MKFTLGKFFNSIPETPTTIYKKSLWCPNCEEKNDLEIPLGETIKVFLSNYKCKNCGCLWELNNKNGN